MKPLCFRGRRQHAAHIHRCPANELLIGADIRRQDVQHLQLGEDVLIDVVLLRRVVPGEALLRLQIRQPHRDQLLQVTAQDRDLSRLTELDQAVGVDRGNGGIAAGEDGQAGHVARLTVGVGGNDRQLL